MCSGSEHYIWLPKLISTKKKKIQFKKRLDKSIHYSNEPDWVLANIRQQVYQISKHLPNLDKHGPMPSNQNWNQTHRRTHQNRGSTICKNYMKGCTYYKNCPHVHPPHAHTHVKTTDSRKWNIQDCSHESFQCLFHLPYHLNYPCQDD